MSNKELKQRFLNSKAVQYARYCADEENSDKIP